jgi:hypothetical protein
MADNKATTKGFVRKAYSGMAPRHQLATDAKRGPSKGGKPPIGKRPAPGTDSESESHSDGDDDDAVSSGSGSDTPVVVEGKDKGGPKKAQKTAGGGRTKVAARKSYSVPPKGRPTLKGKPKDVSDDDLKDSEDDDHDSDPSDKEEEEEEDKKVVAKKPKGRAPPAKKGGKKK